MMFNIIYVLIKLKINNSNIIIFYKLFFQRKKQPIILYIYIYKINFNNS